MSTIEGGMICTNDEEIYQDLRMFRSHGLLRECTSEDLKNKIEKANLTLIRNLYLLIRDLMFVILR